jgi:hypothetical protein
MTRKEIIEAAKLRLPNPSENKQSSIIIVVKDNIDTHQVEFVKCSVNEKQVIRGTWPVPGEGYEDVWIPSEYFSKPKDDNTGAYNLEYNLEKYLLKSNKD